MSRGRAQLACSLVLYALLAAAVCPAGAAAQSGPSLRAVRTQHPPTIDGVIDEGEWRDAASSDVFTQKAPLSGQPPSEHTVLRLLYDDDSLYIAFDCEQRSSPVVEVLSRRDRPTETDSVSIAFDSRANGRNAFEFSVSAAGVLVDGMRFDDGHIAREWDEVWEGKAALRDHGWSAELRIPLQALRFEPSESQVWGLQARRYISAQQETDEWAYIAPVTGAEVSHYGRLTDLNGLRSNSSLELQPFVLARARYQEPTPLLADRGWELRPSGGLDFKWHAGGGVVLNGTLNPDFGQVEADEPILNLSTVELAFPEKRPFFLAGMDDFATMTPIFYSRRIGRTLKSPAVSAAPQPGERLADYAQPAPMYGALKLAVDSNAGWNLAALSALTGPNEVALVQADGTHRPRLIDPVTSFNVVRARVQLAPRLDLGALGTATMRGEPGTTWAPLWLTSKPYYPALPAAGGTPSKQRCPQGELTEVGERCFHDAYVGSIDLVWTSPTGEYALRGQGYGSAIEHGPVRELSDGTYVGSGDLGSGGTLRLSKQGGDHWLLDGTVTAHSRSLDFNDLGLMDRQNVARAGAYAEYRTLDPWLALRETHTSALAYGVNNLDGLQLARGVLLMEHLVFDTWWTLTFGGYANGRYFDDREVGDGTALERAAMLGTFQAITSDSRKPVVVSAQIAEEGLIGGANFNAQLGVSWHPTSSMELQVAPSYTYNYGEPRYAGTGTAANELVFGRLQAKSAGVTVRASCTFLPELTLQSFANAFLASGQYFDYGHVTTQVGGSPPLVWLNDLEPGAAPATRPDFERASLTINVVLRWEYHLGSTLYLLYARTQSPTVSLAPTQSPRLDLNAIRAAPATDLLMLKITYWIG